MNPEIAPNDPRIIGYQRVVNSKIKATWGEVFPRHHAVEGRQGVVIVEFVIHASGAITGLSLARTSGLPEFDEIIRSAVARSAPFPPLPAVFGTSKRWRIAVDARNPAVR